MRAVEQGQTYTVTRRGVPVASLSPISRRDELRCLRPARRRITYSDMVREASDLPSEQILEDLRGDR